LEAELNVSNAQRADELKVIDELNREIRVLNDTRSSLFHDKEQLTG
jgi:hypothetical protein